MPSTLFISAVILKTYKRCAKNLRLFTCGVFVLFFIFPLFCSLATAHAQATSTRDVTPPSTPTNFKVVEASTTEIDLSWDAATDNIGVAGYAILRDSTPPPISGIVGTTYADTGLLPATTYTYVIAAYDSAGNVSAWSEPVSATTMAVSVKFSKNDRVQTTESLNVRSTPSLSGTIVTSEASGTLGHIMGGPVAADGYAWWQVIYDDGISGWSVEDYLVKITESVTATSTYVAFSMGDRVRTTTNLNVRSDPSLSSTIGWVEAPNSLGSIIGGPTSSDSFVWWHVKYDDNATSGWSIEEYLVSIAPTTSNKFSMGDIVQTNSDLSVLSTPTTVGVAVGTEKAGARGTISGGPTPADGYIWWKVTFNDAVTGWCYESGLAKAVISDKFSIGDKVQATVNLNVRAGQSLSAAIVGTESAGAQGIVSGGPINANSYNWWQVTYDDAVSGWSVEGYLIKIAASELNASSSKFAAGNRVKTTANLNIHTLPMVSSTILGTQPSGAQGTITGISYFYDNYWWWDVNYDSGPSGWSVENYLANAVTGGPTVNITSPTNGATVSGDITITATVSGGGSISRVELYWGGSVYFVGYSPPYSFSISTLNFANGKEDIVVKAYDSAGNSYASPTVTVNINNSSKFNAGDRVQVSTTTTNVYADITPSSTISSGPSVFGQLLGTHSSGTLGFISTSSPVYVNGQGWWFIKYDSDPSGWSPEDSLKKYVPPPDTTPPVVSIVSPTSSEIISGTFNVLVNATDNVGVARVYLYVDGTYKGADTQLPYSFVWDTSSTLNATHTLVAVAYDGAGNGTSSLPVVVTTNNPDTTPPVARISYPLNGQTVSGVARVSVSATDNVAVADINLLADGAAIGPAVTSSPVKSLFYTFLWDTNLATNNASHTLNAIAHDASNNLGTSPPVIVGVKNPPPSTKFSIGDRVMAMSSVNVRSLPSTFAPSLAVEPEGSVGTVIGGSEYSDTYFWWEVSFDSGAEGWVAENYLERISENLLIDPGFELGGSAWSDSAFPGRSVTTSDFHGGTHSEEIDVLSTGLQMVSQDVTNIIPGASYTASGWIKASGVGGSGARIYLLWSSSSTPYYPLLSSMSSIYPQGNLVRVDYVGGILGSGGWTNFSNHFTAPWTAKSVRFLLVTDEDTDGVGSAWFDDLGFYNYGPLPTADTTPPTVVINSPKNNSFIPGGTASVYVTATDNTAVSEVDIYIDGNLVASPTVPPYSYSWNTSGTAEGIHTVKAVATDIFNNSSSTTNTFGIDRTPPTTPTGLVAQVVSLTRINLTWSPSSDNIAVAGYKIMRNGSVIATVSSTPSYADNSVSGSACYTYAVSAFDAAGNNSSASTPVSIVTTAPPPSTKFTIGQRVILTSSATNIAVTSAPSTCAAGTPVGTQTYTVDTVPPTVTLTSPADGSTVNSNTLQFTASAWDMGGAQGTVVGGPVYSNASWWWNVNFDSGPSGWVQEDYMKNGGVTKVEFYIKGILISFASSSPYAANFNVSGFPSGGPYPFYAKAYDTAGNVGTSPTNNVSISPPPLDTIPPTITVTSPADNSTLSGVVTVSANASDNVGVTKVEFYVDAMLKDSKTLPPYSFSWDTTKEDNSPHVIYLMAYDAAGNFQASDYLTVTVQN